MSLRDRYKDEKSRCCNPNNKSYPTYGALGCKFKFDSFADWLDNLKKDPHYDDLIAHPDEWQIDKDIKGRQLGLFEYSPATIMIVPVSDNVREANARQSNMTSRFGSDNWSTNKKHKHVVVTFVDGTITEFSSLQEAGAFFNRTDKLIGMYINGKANLPKNVQSICYGGRD